MAATITIEELDRQFGIRGSAKVCAGNGDLPRVQINNPYVQGEIYLYGAHVTSWKPAGHDELLFVSSRSSWQQGQAIRGGIPICFPWFRAKKDDAQAPSHGFARTKMWGLESIVENEGVVAITMSMESDEHTRRWWPGEFRLRYRVVFGAELRIELTCVNTGATTFRIEEALHTYNRVADVQQVKVQGLDHMHFLDNTDANNEKTQSGDVVIVSQTDNAYLNTQNTVDVVDPKLQRRIRLDKINSRNTVVWNPWREGAAKIRDLGDDEWTQFVCVEASNILDAQVALASGQKHTITAVLSVVKL
jgi:glucose-6-phosphate 1-epimerase